MSFAEEHHGLACRYGGDEFVLFAPLQRASDITELAEELLKNQRGRVEGRGKSYVYGTSIGICPYPCGAFTFAEALRAADLALYKAKSRGQGELLRPQAWPGMNGVPAPVVPVSGEGGGTFFCVFIE